MATRDKVARGHRSPTTHNIAIVVHMPPELFVRVRERALEDERSFSNMMVILAKKGLRVRDDNKQF